MLGAALSLVVGAAAYPAAAQELTAGDWKFRAQLYGWFPTVEGTTSHPPSSGTTANLDVGDYLDSLRFVFFGTLEARKGRLGALTDFIYLGKIAIPANAFADVNVRLRGWAWTLVGTYAIVENPSYESQLLGGLRYLKVDNTIDWRFQGNIGSLPPAAVSGSSTVKPDVWDAVVGAKGRMTFGDDRRWFAPYYVDIGTGQSDLTWQAMIGVGYSFSWGEVFAAYRHLDYKFDSKDGLEDLSFSGPGIAFGFRF
jgi:hypothetical protein